MADKEKPEINLPIEESPKVKAQKLWEKVRPFFRLFNVSLGLLLLSTVFLFPYPNPFQVETGIEDYTADSMNKKTVLLQPKNREVIFENFDKDLEEGYCLFGEVNKTHIRIEKVLHNPDPLNQGSKYITNLCINQIKKELPRMYLDYDYKLLGSIHTHPQSRVAEPSLRDIHSLGMKRLFVRVMGVANNRSVNFYSHQSLGMGMPVQYYRE